MAQSASRYSTNRQILSEKVPLNTPYVLDIHTGDFCNVKCKYCIHSIDEKVPEKQHLVKKFFDMDLTKKVTQQILEFPDRLKTVSLSSTGEPLLNKKLPEIIDYMNSYKISRDYILTTNSLLLTKETSRKLIDAGLTRIICSIQGVTSKKYHEVCGTTVNYEELLDNIRYFYNYSRGRCKVHVKTVDIALETGEQELFLEMFNEISDTIGIEEVVPAFDGVDYSTMINKFAYRDIKCCNKPFYTIGVVADGTIVQCCHHPSPILLGNVNTTTLFDAWNSRGRRDFLVDQLKGLRHENEICRKCTVPNNIQKEDILDNDAEKILERII